ncbi:MAG TPA: M14 family zinc carboxypeptidase [Chthoniobacteraceae bacterium]|nr:M14 family zinc carboxypeptidase [Chthoniobacteraceae bacterium]
MPPLLPLFADHPGGNIVLERSEGGRVWLAPDFRHMQEGSRWFYWNFRAQNCEPLTAVFSDRDCIATHGPAISRDGGRTWQWLGGQQVSEERVAGNKDLVEYAFTLPPVKEGEEEVRYAFCPPYLESHLCAWMERHRGNAALNLSELCRSRTGRSVERLTVQDPDAEPSGTVLLTARHHCCESMASYTLEGFLEAALGEDATAQNFRQSHRILAIPFMDKDGVEEGDQGKFRAPHDHNRDYGTDPIYLEVAALMNLARDEPGPVNAFFDFHCPMVHGPWNNRFYMVGSNVASMEQKQDAFAAVFQRSATGPIRLHTEGVLHFGKDWNTAGNYSAGISAATWGVSTFKEAEIVTTLEVPYADAEGVVVTPASARQLGADLFHALTKYLNRA